MLMRAILSNVLWNTSSNAQQRTSTRTTWVLC